MIGEQKLPTPAGEAPSGAEDTVEFELTAEEQLELWRAAAAIAEPVPKPQPPSGYDTFICRRTDRVDRICTVAFATIVLGVTVATGWRVIEATPRPPAAAAVKVTATPALAAAVQPQPGVVQVLNPFDSAEVFEFPANTTESDAREAIAQLLLKRASERLRQGLDVHRIATRHAHATASAPLDVFVTRLSSAEDRLGGIDGLTTERAAAD